MMRTLAAIVLMLTATACEDANDFSPAAKAELVEKQRHHLDDMRGAEAMIRTLSDARTAEGRKRIKEAAAITEQAQSMLNTVENLQASGR